MAIHLTTVGAKVEHLWIMNSSVVHFAVRSCPPRRTATFWPEKYCKIISIGNEWQLHLYIDRPETMIVMFDRKARCTHRPRERMSCGRLGLEFLHFG